MSVGLLRAEKIALTVALARLKRGAPVEPNTAGMCILALARVFGMHDWTESPSLLGAATTPQPVDAEGQEGNRG